MPDAVLARLSRLVVQSHAIITRHQHPNGAYPAAPTFSAYQKYAWFRDGAFTADGVSRFGDVESASAFHDWCDQVLRARRNTVDSLLKLAAGGERPASDAMLPARLALTGTDGEDDWWNFQLDGYGTWLWAVTAHADRHGLALNPWLAGIEVATDYLTGFWAEPCYDWWEEHPSYQHVSTLGAIYAGLRAVADVAALDQARRHTAHLAAGAIRELVLADGVVDGRLTKWLGSTAVDASLLACVVPFSLLNPADPRAANTVRAVQEELTSGYGVHRYRADVFYGGGQWPLLTCLLGWNLHAAGDAAGAHKCLAWVAEQADATGQLPEQVRHHLLAPTHEQKWIKQWGPVAKPLLWSHGMYLTLAAELDATPTRSAPTASAEGP
jgi:isomaltose glucohydrolase